MLKEETAPVKIEPEVEYLVKLFFEANRVSQGKRGLLKDVFIYLRVVHPEWQVSYKLGRKLISESRKVFGRYFNGGKKNLRHKELTSLGAVYDEIDETLGSFRKLFSPKCSPKNGSFPSLDEVISTVAHRTLVRDLYYLAKPEGRPSTAGDRFRSFLQYYGLAGHPTSCREINDMWKMVGDFILGQGRNGVWRIDPHPYDIQEKFPELIQIWQEKHPGQDFFAGRLNTQKRDRV